MTALERHYSAAELAEIWNLSSRKIRDLFRDEPGVIAIGAGTRKDGRKYIRRYFTLRIPESVAIAVHTRMLGRAKTLKCG
jgi:hypothetical protein